MLEMLLVSLTILCIYFVVDCCIESVECRCLLNVHQHQAIEFVASAHFSDWTLNNVQCHVGLSLTVNFPGF